MYGLSMQMRTWSMIESATYCLIIFFSSIFLSSVSWNIDFSLNSPILARNDHIQISPKLNITVMLSTTSLKTTSLDDILTIIHSSKIPKKQWVSNVVAINFFLHFHTNITCKQLSWTSFQESCTGLKKHFAQYVLLLIASNRVL